MAKWIDRAMAVIKWPVAILSLLAFPGLLVSGATVAWDCVGAFSRTWPFFAGAAGYGIAWFVLFRRRSWGAWLSTLEHEFTHALFAWLTFHRVLNVRTTWREGGEVRFVGRGNWLITIAPYFFPTAAVAIAIPLGGLPRDWITWASVLLGVTVAYHVTSTWVETHGRQTDLRKVRLPFAFLFLPSANLLAYGALLAVVLSGWSAAWAFVGDAWRVSVALYGSLL